MQKLVSLKSHTDWSSPGVLLKPDHCKLCAMAASGKAFVPDWVPKNPKIAFILGTPTKDDAIENVPFSGSGGAYWTKLFITDLGLKKEDVLISHAVRCVQPVNKFGKREYPSGFLCKQAELNCRFYDNGLNNFDPNIFIITFDPSTIYSVGCHQRQIVTDVRKGISFASRDYRPCLIMGDGPATLYYPWMKGNGGIKDWRGHWFRGNLPFKEFDKAVESSLRKKFIEG